MRNQGQLKKKLHLLISLLVGVQFAALSGCGGGGDAQQPKRPSEEGNPEAYVEQSCQYSADEGGAVSFETSSTPVVSGYFEKKYNRDWLSAVAHSSMRETLTFIEQTGARVYQANAKSEKSCKPFAFAAPLPADVRKEWVTAEKIIADQTLQTGTKSFIAGLYLPKSEKSTDKPSLKDKGAIVVRADGSRWTLVHEFMHHNFKVQSSAAGIDNDMLQSEYQALGKKLVAGLTDEYLSDREKVKRYSSVFIQFAEKSDLVAVEYPLEEIAIEATLQDQVDSGALTFVPTKSYANATWYIQHSMSTFENLYRAMDDLYPVLREIAATNGLWNEYNLLSRYSGIKAKRAAQMNAMLKKREASQYESFMAGIQNQGEMESTPVSGNVPCAEAAAAYRTIEETTEQISRIRMGL